MQLESYASEACIGASLGSKRSQPREPGEFGVVLKSVQNHTKGLGKRKNDAIRFTF